MKYPIKSLVVNFFALTGLVTLNVHAEDSLSFYQQRLDVQLRYDNRTDNSDRSQYRIRFYPQLNITADWSLHGFVVTGDDFSSSHNTFGDNDSDQIAVRRLYVRRTNSLGKTEFGVIPTYKGRVSSTGMAKDGWFQGLRHVYETEPGQQLEFVVGAINSTNPDQALSIADKLNLFEIEYSAVLNEQHSMELSVERVTGGNYIRGEWRYQSRPERVWFIEYLRRVDKAERKLVLGTENQISIDGYPIDIYAYYAYVSNDFGLRAELTEDFLDTGHGASVELSGALPIAQLDWFSRVDVVDNTKRLLAGVKRSF